MKHQDRTPCSRFCDRNLIIISTINLCGLENLGNTCYFNSSLQLLASSKPFIECLCSCKYEIQGDKEGTLLQSCSFVYSLIGIVESITNKSTLRIPGITSFHSQFVERATLFDNENQHEQSIQSIMEIMEKDVNTINSKRQQRWAMESVLNSIMEDTSKDHSTIFAPITIPTSGFLSSVIICSRCGCRRQIQNTPFYSLSIPLVDTPWWRLDPVYRQNYKNLFRQFHIESSCINTVNPTLHDCLREFTAYDEIDGVTCTGCGLLNSLLVENKKNGDEFMERLSRSLHKVRSSHDLEEDELKEIKVGKGTIQKYELIGRPPRTLLLHLQRKTSSLSFFGKKSQFVEFPLQFDLREFCLFSQSVPSSHAKEYSYNKEQIQETRRLHRIQSWKEETNRSIPDERIQFFESYFTHKEQHQVSLGQRSRTNSMESVGSIYEDVYEILDENTIVFSDDDEEPQQKTKNSPIFGDFLSYHPYMNAESLRGGGQQLSYQLTSVIHHLGSGYGGHYVCFRRVFRNGVDQWFMMNDKVVKEVTWKDVNTNSTYMVQYELV